MAETVEIEYTNYGRNSRNTIYTVYGRNCRNRIY